MLLVEAGKDVTAETAPADVLASYPGRAYFNPDFTWPGLTALLGGANQNDPDEPQARALRAGAHPRRRVEHQRAVANRGAPTDYDGWEELGADGLEFRVGAALLPQARARSDFDGDYHGKDGPITIRRYPVEDWAGFVGIVAKVLGKRGLPLVPDQNGKWEDGVMPVADLDRRERPARLVRDGVSDAGGAARARTSTIRTETYVRRILFEGTRAVGAEIARGDASRGRAAGAS